jgi:hypothetical protein
MFHLAVRKAGAPGDKFGYFVMSGVQIYKANKSKRICNAVTL